MFEKSRTACFTGYRPDKFNFPFKEGNPEYDALCERLLFEIGNAIRDGVRTFLYGGAFGFDILAAEKVLEYRIRTGSPVKIVCAVPYLNQHKNWDAHWQGRYMALQEQIDDSVVLSPVYKRGCFQKRNRFMVDNSSLLIAYYDGKPGGSRTTCGYAVKQGVRLINLA